MNLDLLILSSNILVTILMEMLEPIKMKQNHRKKRCHALLESIDNKLMRIYIIHWKIMNINNCGCLKK
jgi:hypothetical protein